MKTLIVFSSKTGNTEKVARAVHEAIPTAELYPVESAPTVGAYDLVFFGFWVNRGTADESARAYVAGMPEKPVALFATLGAYPDSDHARTSLDNAAALIPSCRIAGRFICHGAVDPALQERLRAFPADHSHAVDEARLKRWADASTHPDEADLRNAREWALRVIEELDARSG
ncbi:MAG: flavodoxin [Spirochaetaceae bacterium]|nr:MAG: flavodoxin [Spirochaetaceae bacterium]